MSQEPAELAAAVLAEEERRLADGAPVVVLALVAPVHSRTAVACTLALAGAVLAAAAGIGWVWAAGVTAIGLAATAVLAWQTSATDLGRGVATGRLRLAAVGLGAVLVGVPVAAMVHRGAAGAAGVVAAIVGVVVARRVRAVTAGIAVAAVAIPAAYAPPVLATVLLVGTGAAALAAVLATVGAVTVPRLRDVAVLAAASRAAGIGGIGGAFVARALVGAHGRPVAAATVAAAGGIAAVAGVRSAEPWLGREAAGAARQLEADAVAENDALALEVRHLDFSYGQVQVLFDVDLRVEAGEVLALLGTNGAGKSTLLRAVSGLGRPDRGTVRLFDETITSLEPGDRVRRGLVQMPGGHCVFPELSVADNLRAGAYTFIWDRALVGERIDRVVELFPVLGRRMAQPAGTLSGGEQQMLGLASSLLLDPRVLLIDELSLGLAPIVVQELLEVLEQLKVGGLTVVIVEQSLNVALAVADRAVFMEKGQVRFEGSAAELLGRDDLARAVFLGGEGG